MSFIETVPEENASGAVAEIYAEGRNASGAVPNYTRAFSLRPEVSTAWNELAHGSVLVERFLEPDEPRAVVTDHRAAGLRALGLSDTEISDVVLAAALRCCFTKVLDGLGTQPDPDYSDTVEPALRELLTVGRPIAERS